MKRTTTALPLITVAATIIAGTAASRTLVAQPAQMKPGQYEMTSEMAMAGRAVKLPARKDVACVTADDLKDWSRNLVKTSDRVTCKLSDYKPSGNHLTFVRQCTTTSGQQTTYEGDVTFTPPDSYHAVMNFSGGAPGSPTAGSTITINARRVGDCAK